MGFLDKAKKLAEQAQDKLDEVQGQFNASHQQGGSSGPVVEYDEHGRPISGGDAPAAEPEAPAAPPVPDAPTPPTAPVPPGAPASPASGSEPPAPRRDDDDTPPPVTSGDPLSG